MTTLIVVLWTCLIALHIFAYFLKKRQPYDHYKFGLTKLEQKDPIEEEIFAWKAFRINRHGTVSGLVYSGGYNLLDTTLCDGDIVMEAEADNGTTVLYPSRNGFYSFTTAAELIKQTRDELSIHHYEKFGWDVWFDKPKTYTHQFLWAKIQVHGKVLTCSKGFLSEKMDFIELYSWGSDKYREQLAQTIGWPGKIHPFNEVPDFKKFYKIRDGRLTTGPIRKFRNKRDI